MGVYKCNHCGREWSDDGVPRDTYIFYAEMLYLDECEDCRDNTNNEEQIVSS